MSDRPRRGVHLDEVMGSTTDATRRSEMETISAADFAAALRASGNNLRKIDPDAITPADDAPRAQSTGVIVCEVDRTVMRATTALDRNHVVMVNSRPDMGLVMLVVMTKQEAERLESQLRAARLACR